MNPTGLVTLKSFTSGDGRVLSASEALKRGLVVLSEPKSKGWKLDSSEVPLGENLFVDNGRQLLAYCFGGRSPLSDFYISRFGIGTGTTAPASTNTSLENPIYFDPPTNSVYTKEVSAIDFPSPYSLRVEFTIGAGDGNGYLITELGLFSGSGTMVARRTNVGINKTSDFAPQLLWRIRF